MNFITQYINAFYHLFLEMAPYLVLGFVLAGILHVFAPQSFVSKNLGKPTFGSVLKASLLGIPLPLCSCGVIPTGISFHKQGASKGAAVSFLISTPQTGVDSILITYSMLGLPFAIIRPIAALVTGVFGGTLVNKIKEQTDKPVSKSDTASCATKAKSSVLKQIFNYAFVDFLQDISRWLLIGLAVAALVNVVVPDSFFQNYLSEGWMSMLIILVVSVPLYVCATGSVPIGAVLLAKGLSPGTVLVFLMAGPATNLATYTVIYKSLGRKIANLYVGSIVVGALLFGLLIDYVLPFEWFGSFIPLSEDIHQHGLPLWLVYSTSLFLAFTLFRAEMKKIIQHFFNKNKSTTQTHTDMDNTTIIVKGMTCNHCKGSVEKHLGAVPEVKEVLVDLQSNEVTLLGDKINLTTIKEIITEIGFDYKGEK